MQTWDTKDVVVWLFKPGCAEASDKDRHLQIAIQVNYHSHLSSDEINHYSETSAFVFMARSRSQQLA